MPRLGDGALPTGLPRSITKTHDNFLGGLTRPQAILHGKDILAVRLSARDPEGEVTLWSDDVRLERFYNPKRRHLPIG
jgi:hypothetical protein